jgi:uncharacterized protein involved in tolerance to divalent cations
MVAVIITYPARCVCKAGGVKLPREMLIRKKVSCVISPVVKSFYRWIISCN